MAPSTAVATVTRVPTVNTTTESLQLVRGRGERSTVHAPVEHDAFAHHTLTSSNTPFPSTTPRSGACGVW